MLAWVRVRVASFDVRLPCLVEERGLLLLVMVLTWEDVGLLTPWDERRLSEELSERYWVGRAQGMLLSLRPLMHAPPVSCLG